MAKTKLDKIASIDEEMKQLAVQRTKLMQSHREQERKDRTRRLCQRGGLLEKMLPDTISLTDEQFQSFLEKTVANDFGRRTLDKITAQNAAANHKPEPTGAAAQGTIPPTTKSTETVQNNGKDEDTDKGESARVSG